MAQTIIPNSDLPPLSAPVIRLEALKGFIKTVSGNKLIVSNQGIPVAIEHVRVAKNGSLVTRVHEDSRAFTLEEHLNWLERLAKRKDTFEFGTPTAGKGPSAEERARKAKKRADSIARRNAMKGGGGKKK